MDAGNIWIIQYGSLNSYLQIGEVYRNVRCTFFFVHHYTNLFIFFKLQSFEDFFDYVLSASKNSSCKLIKQYNQPVHTFFSHFCTYLFYIEGNGKEGKVHGEFVYSKMSETFIVHIAMY